MDWWMGGWMGGWGGWEGGGGGGWEDGVDGWPQSGVLAWKVCAGHQFSMQIMDQIKTRGIEKCCTVCAGRSFSRVGFEKWKMRCRKVMYCVRRTLIF